MSNRMQLSSGERSCFRGLKRRYLRRLKVRRCASGASSESALEGKTGPPDPDFQRFASVQVAATPTALRVFENRDDLFDELVVTCTDAFTQSLWYAQNQPWDSTNLAR
jgi:hypothetical protein